MAGVQVEPRQVVVERHVVDGPRLEQRPGQPVEGDVVVAGEYVVVLEESARCRQVPGDELVVAVEARPVAPAEQRRNIRHALGYARHRGTGIPGDVRCPVRRRSRASLRREYVRSHGEVSSGPTGGMAAVPGHLETDRQPPMTVPLRHFVVGLGFLVAGVAVGVAAVAGAAPGLAGPAHLHLLLVGWVCVTIMDAMTQFVPVWSGTTLHSRRLASAQLALVTVGLAGFATALLAAAPAWLAPAGALVVLGFDEDGAEHAGADVLVHVRDRTVVDEHAGVHRFEPDGGGLAGGDSSVLGTAARPVDGVDVDVVRHRAVGLAGEAQRHRVAAADPELAVRDAIGAIEHTVPGNHVNLATHGDLGLPGEFLYDALSTEYPDLEYEYVEQCGCGGHVTRVYVE